jgi:hypothetical protein
MDEEFNEKIDAMRMTLELAIHDIEAQRAGIQELRMLSANQYDSIQALAKTSGELVETARNHERRIQDSRDEFSA